MPITYKFRILHIVTHICAALGMVWAYNNPTSASNWLWLAFAAFLFCGIVGVNIGLHRYWSHRSFKTGPLRDWFLLIASFFPMLGSPTAWGVVHIYHHIHSDDDKDPHSPKNAGLFGSWFTFWPKMNIPLSVYKRFADDKRLTFMHRNYFLLTTLYVLILALIDIRLVAFLWAIPAVGCFHGAASVGVLPHLRWIPGNYRRYDIRDNSCNSIITVITSLGEGWHNNHHHWSNKYRHGERWWEIDVSAFLIKWIFAKK